MRDWSLYKEEIGDAQPEEEADDARDAQPEEEADGARWTEQSIRLILKPILVILSTS